MGDIWRVDAFKLWSEEEVMLSECSADVIDIKMAKLTWIYGTKVHPELRLRGTYAHLDQAKPLNEMEVVALFATDGFPTERALRAVGSG